MIFSDPRNVAKLATAVITLREVRIRNGLKLCFFLSWWVAGLGYTPILGGGFKYFYIFNFHPYLGKVSNLTNIFQMG